LAVDDCNEQWPRSLPAQRLRSRPSQTNLFSAAAKDRLTPTVQLP